MGFAFRWKPSVSPNTGVFQIPLEVWQRKQHVLTQLLFSLCTVLNHLCHLGAFKPGFLNLGSESWWIQLRVSELD